MLQEMTVIRLRKDCPVAQSGSGACDRMQNIGLVGDAGGHDVSSDGLSSHGIGKARRPREVQSAHQRLNRPGMRAVQQMKPEVVFMRHHAVTLGTRPGQVNRRQPETDRTLFHEFDLSAPLRRPGASMGRSTIESPGANDHMRTMSMLGFHVRVLRSAGILLNRR